VRTLDLEEAADFVKLHPHTVELMARSGNGEGLPNSSGIYFLWALNQVFYVGRSECMRKRVRLGAHHVLARYHSISYVLIEKERLHWAECYYIGVLQPEQNFAKRNWRTE
jgi:excinuclease UvrABC nuclease subunit